MKIKFAISLLTAILISEFAFNQIRSQINSLTDQLQKDPTVHFGYGVGFAGIPETNNSSYIMYRKLARLATNDELVQLTHSPAACLVIYSFSILLDREDFRLRGIFIQHLSDSTFFWTAGGCTGISDRVNWFMLKKLKPRQSSASVVSLSKDDYEKYCNRFKKESNLFECM